MAKAIFGIELEVPLKQGVTCDDFRNCLAEAIGPNLVHFTRSGRMVGYHSDDYENNIDKWRVASDGSLSQFQGRGVEIVSRRRTTLEETKKAMESTRHLIDLELMKTTTCGGHHVHIGIAHFSAIKRTYNPEIQGDLDKLIRTKRVKLLEIKIHEVYSYFQPVIDSLLSRSRRSTSNNSYCRPVSSYYLDSLNGNDDYADRRKERYLNDRNQRAPLWGNRGVVNFGKLDSYGTVEFRQHQQTYHVATVQNWVRLMHRLTSRCWVQETKNIDPRDFSLTIDGFADYLGLGQNRLRAWMRRRANHFGFNAIAQPRDSNRIIGINQRGTEGNNHDSVIDAIEDENSYESVRADIRRILRNEPLARNELYDEIMLQCQNDFDLYHNLRDTWTGARNGMATFTTEVVNTIMTNALPQLWRDNTVEWSYINWHSLRDELVEVMES